VTANAPDTLPMLPEPEKPFQPAPFMLVFIPLQAQQAVMPALQTGCTYVKVITNWPRNSG